MPKFLEENPTSLACIAALFIIGISLPSALSVEYSDPNTMMGTLTGFAATIGLGKPLAIGDLALRLVSGALLGTLVYLGAKLIDCF